MQRFKSIVKLLVYFTVVWFQISSTQARITSSFYRRKYKNANSRYINKRYIKKPDPFEFCHQELKFDVMIILDGNQNLRQQLISTYKKLLYEVGMRHGSKYLNSKVALWYTYDNGSTVCLKLPAQGYTKIYYSLYDTTLPKNFGHCVSLNQALLDLNSISDKSRLQATVITFDMINELKLQVDKYRSLVELQAPNFGNLDKKLCQTFEHCKLNDYVIQTSDFYSK